MSKKHQKVLCQVKLEIMVPVYVDSLNDAVNVALHAMKAGFFNLGKREIKGMAHQRNRRWPDHLNPWCGESNKPSDLTIGEILKKGKRS